MSVSDRHAAVAASAMRAALSAAESHVQAIVGVNNSAPGNSRTLLYARERASSAFREACDAAANRIAEVEGAAAVDYADDVPEIVEQARQTISAAFSKVAARFNRFPPSAIAAAGTPAADMERVVAATIDDLRLGIAGGANVDRSKSRIISIDNRGGSGQFAVDSPGSQQSVGHDLTAQASSAGDLFELVSALRLELAKGDVPAHSDIDDAAVNLQRELQQEAPNPGRLKRLATAVGDFSVKAGAGAAGGFLARIAAIAAGIP